VTSGLLGRIDDVMNISATVFRRPRSSTRWSGTPRSPNAAVVGASDDLTGQAIVAFVTLRLSSGRAMQDQAAVIEELRVHVAKGHQPDRAAPSDSSSPQNCPRLARARSCVVCCVTWRENRQLGDVTTLMDPTVVNMISA